MAQSKNSTLSVQSLGSKANIDDEDDEAVGAAFLAINRNIVKTAHEPKPPKDYVDSSTNLIESANKAANKSAAPSKPPIRMGPTISVGTPPDPKDDDDDQKFEPKSDDQSKKSKKLKKNIVSKKEKADDKK